MSLSEEPLVEGDHRAPLAVHPRSFVRRLLLALVGMALAAVVSLCIAGWRQHPGRADVGVVFGTTVHADGTPSPRLAARLDQAAALFSGHAFPFLIVSGGLGKEGVAEGTAMKTYLVQHGVPEDAILVDNAGESTWKTAENVTAFMKTRGLTSVCLVSQFFHLPRARLAFHRLGISTVYDGHPKYMDWRDPYSIARELVAYPRYAYRPLNAPPVSKELSALERSDYERRMAHLAHRANLPSGSELRYPLAGALLPYHRIVAYYGNFYSKHMGILGEFPAEEVLARLRKEATRWQDLDPGMPVIPAIHYIAVAAQGYAGADGKYRLRMPSSEIEKAFAMAQRLQGILFLDIQVGRSDVQNEVPHFDEYLKRPNVQLGIDPEFYMKGGRLPGKVIGNMDAAEINWTINHLTKLVRQHHLAPKILVIHRFTNAMVTHYREIHPTPEVQVVMDMDGWGDPRHKRTTFHQVIEKEPVQFAGFKLFYKNDRRVPGSRMLTPDEVLALNPQPVYIQYQ